MADADHAAGAEAIVVGSVGSRSEVTLDNGSRVVVADWGPSGRPVSVVALPGWKGADVGLRNLVARTAHAGFRVLATALIAGAGSYVRHG